MASPRLNERYQMVRPLGSGADASVWLALDAARDDAPRALKLVRGLGESDARERLAGEFRRLAALSHPRLVRVYDLEVARNEGAWVRAGTPFFTADYVEGRTPPEIVRALPVAERARALHTIACDVAAALAHVHASGLVHHDVKPDNIVVSPAGRATLLDLGLSAARAALGVARGTPAYMAPEAFLGVDDPRVDLYALGATLYETACGRPPFSGADLALLLRAALESAPAAPRSLAAWLPAPFEEVILKLLQRAPEGRHSTAAVLLDDLARVGEAMGWDDPRAARPRVANDSVDVPATLLPPPLVQREAPLAALGEAVAALAEDRPGRRVLALAGPPGVGKTRLIEEAVRAHQLRAAAGRSPPLRVIGDAWPRVAAALGLELRERDDSPESAERVRARLAEKAQQAIAAAAAAGPVLVHLGDAGVDDRSRALLALAAAAEPEAGPWMLVAELGEEEGEPPPLRLAPLDAAGVDAVARSMLGRAVPPAWARALADATGGVPRLVVEAVRAAAARAGVDRADRVPVAEVLGDGGLADVLGRRVAALSAPARALVEALAVWRRPGSITDLSAVAGLEVEEAYAEAAALAARGMALAADGGLYTLPSREHARAVEESLAPARKTALHRAALRRLEARPDPRARARHLVVVGPAADAAQALLEAAAACRGEGDLGGALAFLEEAARLGRGPERTDAQLAFAELAVVVSRYDDALEAAGAAAAARDAGRRRRAQLLSARALGRSGRLDEATRQLERLIETEDGGGSSGSAGRGAEGPLNDEDARGMLARLHVQRGAFREALAVAGTPEGEPPPTGAVSAGRAARLEAAGLAALYGGDLERADHAFTRLQSAADGAADRALRSRALGLLGLLAEKRGDMPAAADRAGQAFEHARAVGDVHAAAVHAMNRANALAEQGLWGDVLSATAEALFELRRLGRVSEVAPALVNRGLALLAYGDRESAARACEQALGEARARGLVLVEAWATMLEGDIQRQSGAPERALDAYDRAARLAKRAGSGEAFAEANRAEVLAELGRAAEARAAVEAALALCADPEQASERDRLLLSQARVALAAGQGIEAAAAALVPAARRLGESGRLDLAWRAEALAARLHRRAGDAVLAADEASRARAVLDGLVARAPEARRDGLLADPEARALRVLEGELGERRRSQPQLAAAPAPAADGAATERLRRLFTLSKRLNGELRLEPLLDDIIDTVIELTSAERGFLLLFDDKGGGGRLEPRVARNIDHRALVGDELAVSRSIAEQAAKSGEPVLTIDAAFDERFGQAASVSALRLRSVLAVPLRVHGQVVGCVYVDHRFRRGAFSEDAVELVLDLADVAAIALHNARLVSEVESLNQRLAEDLERKAAELDGARAALRSAQALEIRYPYDALIGRSPRMLELLRIVDRATATALPVVIYGESGTGKELVARALHQNGPRAGRAFVPVNCAAVPEALLEAELFGHVRGAFTGADRDRRGLFEVADGGTLFLDEIADTSPAMQTKLLRVLQSGEIRRVGGERGRVVDVRVVAASNRDLRKQVEEGRFREDLFYRLHVIRIDVPTLRERSEDIPALVTHFLKKLADGGAVKTVDRAAMARLVAHPWPGNVRELENELARASALGGDVVGVADLSPAIAATDPTAMPAEPDDLRMRPRVERMEKQLIREALGRANGNQTLAARALGLSRFGLQKKLKRYGL